MIIPRKLLGDAREVLLKEPANSVHAVVTSPPYWRLRQYLAADDPNKAKEIGCEDLLADYLTHMVQAFRAVRHILREDGTLWVNLGDCYANDKKYGKPDAAGIRRDNGLTSKNLFLLPFRVAQALQEDGWIVRAVCPWIKRNVYPESVKDRPPVAVEYVLMLSKSIECFYDPFPILIDSSPNTHPKNSRFNETYRDIANSRPGPKTPAMGQGVRANQSFALAIKGEDPPVRMRRNSDWFMESFQGLIADGEGFPMAFLVNTKGTSLNHFASYPPDLIRPIILCSTSEQGCCSQCGNPLIRQVKRVQFDRSEQYGGKYDEDRDRRVAGSALKSLKAARAAGRPHDNPYPPPVTTGWKRSCECAKFESVPCTIADPFHGLGTTAQVASSLGRNYLGCELSPAYFKMSDVRDGQTAMKLL